MNANSNEIEHQGLKTKIKIQNLNSLWHKNTLRDSSTKSLPQDSQDSIMEEDYIEAEDSTPEDPGPSPFFMFLP